MVNEKDLFHLEHKGVEADNIGKQPSILLLAGLEVAKSASATAVPCC